MEVPSNPSAPIANPVAVRARNRGETVANPYLFGVIEDGGRKYAVSLLAGQHAEGQSREEALFLPWVTGLLHPPRAMTKGKDKVVSICRAIYATSVNGTGKVRWRSDCHTNGGDFNMVLRMEWKSPSHKSTSCPVLQYIANRKILFTVRTFYPELLTPLTRG